MSDRIRPSQIAGMSPIAHRPRAAEPIARVDRAVHPVGMPARHDVAWLSEAAQALQSEEAARIQASLPPMAQPPGDDAAPFP